MQDSLAVRITHRRLHHALGLVQHDALLAPCPQAFLRALRDKVPLQLYASPFDKPVVRRGQAALTSSQLLSRLKVEPQAL
jgi:hypothetical protein